MAIVKSSLGYPRIGENREWKKKLESYWKGDLAADQFENEMKDLRLQHLKKQHESGLDYVPVGDFSYYDHMLDMAMMFNLVPKRFYAEEFVDSRDLYFALARGSKNAEACEMTKWFNTNYHYIVPEIEESWVPKITTNRVLTAYLEAKEEAGIDGKPVIVGPFTFLKLAKGYPAEQFAVYLDVLLPLYAQVLSELTEAGAKYIQVDEPAFVLSLSAEEKAIAKDVYGKLASLVPEANLIIQTYFEAITDLEAVLHFPVAGVGIDLVHDKGVQLEKILSIDSLPTKILALGVIDGRNIWRSDLRVSLEKIEKIQKKHPQIDLWIQPSSSLLHVPVSLSAETTMSAEIKEGMAFADEKLQEVVILEGKLSSKREAEVSFTAHTNQYDRFKQSFRQVNNLDQSKNVLEKRAVVFAERQKIQQEKFNLPLLPTTTIGSFPQTIDMRKARTAFRKGELKEEAYQAMVEEKMQKWIEIQEKLGLDVFVHGEFERNDMVEFFGEKLNGYVVSKNGWVQSYGSRCVKPPIIYADISFDQPMTVQETVYAQSLTKKPVKGMLTGPVTILNWSFARDDLSGSEIADQIAYALVEEIERLESAGIEMIQVDEPALREGLPLKEEDQDEYLTWAVASFRKATAQVKATTQIHTHMCYSEFHEMMDAISDLDADVISIETSRSHGELIGAFETNVYDKGIGLGVYDIHSPRIPDTTEMVQIIEDSLKVLPANLFWINPDCGLKTRTEEQTVQALEKMQEAAKIVREQLSAKAVN